MRTGSTASLPSLISLVSSAVCSWTLGSKAKPQTSSSSHRLPLIASSAAFLMSPSPTVPNSGPTHTRTRRAAIGLALGLDVLAGERVEPVNVMPLILVRALTPALRRLSRIVDRKFCDEPEALATVGRSVANASGSFGGQRSVRRQALHGERPGQPHGVLVVVGLVVECLGVGVAAIAASICRGSSRA